MELVRGVYQIKIPLSGILPPAEDTKPLKIGKEKLMDVIEQKILKPKSVSHVNAYLIEGTKENMLIDTGWDTPDAFTALNKELRSYGFTFKDISQIIVTHVHPDHYGLAGKLKQLCGGRLALSEIEAELLDTRYVHTAELLKQMRWFLLTNGVPKSSILQLSEVSMPARKFVVPTTPDIILKEGKKISLDPFEFKVLLTPGHSPGHICLYEPNRKLLFSGDHILPEITPNISLHPQSGENPLGDYLNSLEQMMKLEVTMAFPGHGPAFSGIRQIIDGIFRHHDQRSKAILKVLQETTKTAYQVATEIPWQDDTKAGGFHNLSIFDQRLAITETLAHIEFLRREGKVQLFQQEDTNLYFAGG